MTCPGRGSARLPGTRWKHVALWAQGCRCRKAWEVQAVSGEGAHIPPCLWLQNGCHIERPASHS